MALSNRINFRGGQNGQLPILNAIYDGAFDASLTFSGNITEGAGYATVTRNSSDSGGHVNIDLTRFSTLSIDSQNASSSYYLRVLIDGSGVIATSGTSRGTWTYDVSSLIGLHRIDLLIYSGNSTAKVYNLIFT